MALTREASCGEPELWDAEVNQTMGRLWGFEGWGGSLVGWWLVVFLNVMHEKMFIFFVVWGWWGGPEK